MTKTFSFFKFSLFVCFLSVNLAAQKKDRVEAFQKIFTDAALKNCKDFKAGGGTVFPKPNYPAEAKADKIGGSVRVWIKVDEKGSVGEIERVEGNKILQEAATGAARRAKFSPTICDGAATKVSAVLTYNFIPFINAGNYFTPTKSEEFIDIKTDSPFFEAISNLTENYKLAFGYADRKFHADAPLTRGDFAQSLRLTLDLLSERATAANKIPREINLFYPLNPQKLTSAAQIKDLKKNEPFEDSVKTLLLKYDIALTNESGEFQGKVPLSNNETIDLWTKIFGEDAIPVNSRKIADGDRLISRGEFALFLQESLQVLTYKVLP